MTPPPPRRVAVTGPRTSAARRQSSDLRRRALDDQDVVGQLLIRSLVRTQLRLALRVGAALFGTLGLLPLLFALVPVTRTVRLLGLPLPWLVLGVLVYPSLMLVGRFYVRVAERNERDFVELVSRQ